MPTGLMAWLAVAVIVTIAASLLVDRFRKGDTEKERSKAVTTGVTVISTVFVFTMALLFSDARGQIAQARATTYAESAALQEAYINARNLDASTKAQVRQKIEAYTRAVVDHEWPLMARGQASTVARQEMDDLRYLLEDSRPVGDAQKAALSKVSSDIDEAVSARRDRRAQLTNSLPPLVLGGMVVTGLIMVGLMISGAASRRPTDLAALSLAVAAVAFQVYLVVQTNHAYGGGISLGPEAFQAALARYPTVTT